MDNILKYYPFDCVLSLEPLIEYAQKKVAQGVWPRHPLGDDFAKRLANEPVLSQPIRDLALLEEHRGTVLRLMSLVFPPASWESHTFAAMVPFTLQAFHYSPRFDQMFLGKQGRFNPRYDGMDEEELMHSRAMRAYQFILKEFYDLGSKMEIPMISTAFDPETGLNKHFAFDLDFRFLRLKALNGLPSLSERDKAFIMENLANPTALKEILPPENFRIEGFVTLQAVEVTPTRVISALSRDLISQDSIVTQTGFDRVQQNLRTLFKRSELIASLMAIHNDRVMVLNTGCELKQMCIFGDSLHVPLEEFKGSLFERLSHSEDVILVPDVQQEPELAQWQEAFTEKGIRCLMAAPLFFQGKLIGVLDLGSSNPGEFGAGDALIMAQIQPLFTVAIHNALEDLDKQVQSIIKQQCTAVHPAVEWRFQEAAFKHLEHLRTGQGGEMEPIIFRDVLPLYGASDIRGSSNERNRAIAQDLSQHLDLGLAVVQRAQEARPMPILKELAGRLQRQKEHLSQGLKSRDETAVASFMRQEVETIFDELAKQGPEVEEAIAAYRVQVDPSLGTVYNKRRLFEQSVSLLNERLAAYLDQEEAELQATVPHYYQRHRTDGVDYLMYLGASLNPDGDYSSLYLRNLRLWQLMVTCGLAWHTEQLKQELPVALDTAHLILVQDTPLSIRFRYDEKRFDVDGAYDVRHEIVRSRLDKAVIEGGERLTQPGQIAVVYSQMAEAREMRRHIEYLQEEGLLTEQVERHALEDLPGVHGLRALRLTVDLDSPELAARAQLREVPVALAEAS